MSVQSEYTKRAICHEAGHAVAALHFGFRVERIEVFRGMPRSLIAIERSHEMIVVLAGGIAAEQLVFGRYDAAGYADDQRKVSECGGTAIDSYLSEACNVIRSNEDCFRQLRERLTLRWVENWGEWEMTSGSNADCDSLTFELLLREDIEAIWTEAAQNRSAEADGPDS